MPPVTEFKQLLFGKNVRGTYGSSQFLTIKNSFICALLFTSSIYLHYSILFVFLFTFARRISAVQNFSEGLRFVSLVSYQMSYIVGLSFTIALTGTTNINLLAAPLLNLGISLYFLPAFIIPPLWWLLCLRYPIGQLGLFPLIFLTSALYPGPIRPLLSVWLPALPLVKNWLNIAGIEGLEFLVWTAPFLLARTPFFIKHHDRKTSLAGIFLTTMLVFTTIFFILSPLWQKGVTPVVARMNALLVLPESPRQPLRSLIKEIKRNYPDVYFDLIIFPESAIRGRFDIRTLNERLKFLKTSTGVHSPLLLQASLADPANNKIYNSAIMYSKGMVYRRDKTVLFPFFEEHPPSLKSEPFSSSSKLSRGETRDIFTFHNQEFTPIICLESIQNLKKYSSNRSALIIELSNNSHFKGTPVVRWHFNYARLRSVESGVPLLRVALNGKSALIDSNGHTRPIKNSGFEIIEVNLSKYRSFYYRHQNLIVFTIFLCCLLELSFIRKRFDADLNNRPEITGQGTVGALITFMIWLHAVVLSFGQAGLWDLLWICNASSILFSMLILLRYHGGLGFAVFFWTTTGGILWFAHILNNPGEFLVTSLVAHLVVPLLSGREVFRRGIPGNSWLWTLACGNLLLFAFLFFHPFPIALTGSLAGDNTSRLLYLLKIEIGFTILILPAQLALRSLRSHVRTLMKKVSR